jgi:hypothetical protein
MPLNESENLTASSLQAARPRGQDLRVENGPPKALKCGMKIDQAAVALRLRILQEALGYSREQMALDAGYANESAWSNVIGGAKKAYVIGAENAFRLYVKHGVSLDWIYAGRHGGNADALRGKIMDIETRLARGEALVVRRRSRKKKAA